LTTSIEKKDSLQCARQSSRKWIVQPTLSVIFPAAASKLQGKIATGDFDVFLCHNVKAKPRVKEIGEKLKEQGIYPGWMNGNYAPDYPGSNTWKSR